MTRLSVVAVLALFLTVPLLAGTDLVVVNTPPSPQYTPAGQLMLLFFGVRNDGPDIARDVKLAIEVPAGLDVETIQGVECDRSARPLRCVVGDMGLGELKSFDFRMRGPVANAMYTMTATVSSSTSDRDPSNNSVSVTYDNRVDAALVVTMYLNSVRLDPGEAFRFPSRINSYFETESPRDLRMQYDVPGAIIEKIEAPPQWSCTLAGEHRRPNVRVDDRRRSARQVDHRSGDAALGALLREATDRDERYVDGCGEHVGDE